MSKKVIDLNNKDNIMELSTDIENVSKNIMEPIRNAINVLSVWEQDHDLTISQIQQIYKNLNVSANMSPDEMDKSLRENSNNIVIIEKKYLKTYMCKSEFSSVINSIMEHFSNTLSPNIITAISSIIKNFSIICLTSNRREFSYKDVCFKFFTRCKKNNEILVLVLNIHYEQKAIGWKLLEIVGCNKEKISLSFLGALIKTDVSRVI